MKHARALHATLWYTLLAQTPTPSLHSPEKSSVRLVHHQNLIVHPHLPGSSHIHAYAYPCAVRHQLRILISTAASTVDLTPPRHPSAPTISKVAQVACQRVRSGAGSALGRTRRCACPPSAHGAERRRARPPSEHRGVHVLLLRIVRMLLLHITPTRECAQGCRGRPRVVEGRAPGVTRRARRFHLFDVDVQHLPVCDRD